MPQHPRDLLGDPFRARAGTRSNRVMISRTCDTVTAGVFPPETTPLPDQEPQRQKRQRHVVVPAHPAPDLVVRQPGFSLAGLQRLLDPVAGKRTRTNSASDTSASALLNA